MHISGWCRPFPLCTRAPSSNVHVFSHPEPGAVPKNKCQQQHWAHRIVRGIWRIEDIVARRGEAKESQRGVGVKSLRFLVETLLR